MQHQYCIRILAESFSGKRSTSALITAINNISEIGGVELLQTNNQHLLQLKISSDSGFKILQSRLQAVSTMFQVDLILHHWRHRASLPGLIIMDMDSTLVQAETIDEIARVAGVGDKVTKITASAMAGELDFTESLKARVSMLEGISLEAIDSVHDCLPLTPGAENLLMKAKANGCHTALVSGGFTLFAQPIAEKLAFDTLSANVLEIEDGRLTGKVIGSIVDGNSKLETLNQLQQQLGLERQQIIAIGDGANDLPMLSAAGTGIAFHAKPKVQQQATAILNFNDLNAVCWLFNW